MKPVLTGKNEVAKKEETGLSLGSQFPGAVNVKERALKAKEEEGDIYKKFLPIMHFCHEDTKELTKNSLVIKHGNSIRSVENSFAVSHIISRDFIRRLEGKEYKDRAFAPLRENEKGTTTDDYLKNKEKAFQGIEGWQAGTSTIFALIEGKKDPVITLVQIEAAGPGSDMWTRISASSCVEDSKIVRFKSNDFSKIQATSAKGFEYLASWKMDKMEDILWFEEEMSPEVGSLISEAYIEQKEQVDNFIKK